MLGRKKHTACAEHLDALTRAQEGRRESADALQEQRAKASAERSEVIVPLRELRRRNHFAEMIVATILDGHSGEE